MSRETSFLIYCMERYRYYKQLSGADVAELFGRYDIYGYVLKYFEALHTMGDDYIIRDIDEYVGSCDKDSGQMNKQKM